MDKKILFFAALLLPLAASAQTLQLPAADTAAEVPAVLPERGQSMATVERLFGAPKHRHGPVGGDSKLHPPITRWDYDGFYVVFEHDKVIDAVIPGAPPPLHHRDELQPAD